MTTLAVDQQKSRIASDQGQSVEQTGRELVRYLDTCFSTLEFEETESAIGDLVEQLNAKLESVRRTVSEADWRERLSPICREHKVASILSEDPYTRRALEKPRGFAGDAALLDYVYFGDRDNVSSTTGGAIMAATAGSPSGQSVVDRRERLAEAIRHASSLRTGARVLSIACGHLRELELLSDHETIELHSIVALDQDRKALSTVAGDHDTNLVSTVHASVRDVLANRAIKGKFELVYAAGLFDYLSDYVAVRLMRRMFSLAAPGGRVLVGNFTPTNSGRAYMEAFMDWHLEYRSTTDMRRIAREAANDTPVLVEKVYEDDHANIAYADVVIR